MVKARAAATALAGVLALTLTGCTGDQLSDEEAFIAAVREGAPENTEDDETLLRNAEYACDEFADADNVPEIVDLLDSYDGDSKSQHEFNAMYFRAATTHLCPEVREDYETAAALHEDGSLN